MKIPVLAVLLTGVLAGPASAQTASSARLPRRQRWRHGPSPATWIAYLAAGLAITVALEWSATAVFDRWQYAAEMPTVPWLGTGLTPLLQWLLLPPLVVVLARGQLRGRRAAVTSR